MKNEHIKVGMIVPEVIRLQVYKEVLSKINNGEEIYGLCLQLPMTLWGLPDFLDDGPDNVYWSYYDTERIFPEMKGIFKAVKDRFERDQIRKVYLENAIKSLTKKLKQ